MPAQPDGLRLPTPADVAAYREWAYPAGRDLLPAGSPLAELIPYFDRLAQLDDPGAPLRYPRRDAGAEATADTDPHRAIVRFCDVRGADRGVLSGWRIGVKDSIAVGGVPMAGGNPDLAPATPTEDAVVVERLLDAGGAIVATTRISFGGLNPLTDTTTRNPFDGRVSAGGTSAGSAVAVATGLVDAALGTDAAGSVRIPAAWCGVVGMKATHGVIPLHGARDHWLNTIGPITRTVFENAVAFDVLAGPDWRDPQACSGGGHRPDGAVAAQLGREVRGLTIGVVQEALEPSGCSDAERTIVDAACDALATTGVRLRPVSIPLWTSAAAIYWPLYVLGVVHEAQLFGQGYGNRGRVDMSLLRSFEDFHESTYVRQCRLFVEHLRHVAHGRHFAKAQNLALELRRQVDSALREVDVLVTPTTPGGAFDLEPSDGTRPTVEDAARNTWVFNLTGHPALSIPADLGPDGVPRGIQFAARRFEETAAYRAAFAFEQV